MVMPPLAVRRAALALAALIAVKVLGLRWMSRWGATGDELAATLPGDELVPHPDLTTTRAVTINARAADVWPWIAQLGQGRGGFYSYDTLENLVGCDIHSADRIVPAWQSVVAGAQVRLAPEVAMTVAVAEPGHALVLRGGIPMGSGAAPFDCTWTFVLREETDGTTRLVSRERYGYLRWWAGFVVVPTSVISFVMSQKMLRGIAERAEHAALGTHPVAERAGHGLSERMTSR
ncbi:MAG: hypothetical protein QOI16_1899 [Pseudonocardiales bacterium]|nr:hypothetical protein [Pseudonocardiales bacterium]